MKMQFTGSFDDDESIKLFDTNYHEMIHVWLGDSYSLADQKKQYYPQLAACLFKTMYQLGMVSISYDEAPDGITITIDPCVGSPFDSIAVLERQRKWSPRK